MAAAQSGSGGDAVLVVAIDFGTTYSGYAFSFGTDFNRDPLNVHCQNFSTASSERALQTSKIPTCVLFNPDQQFAAFGLEAEEMYAKMADENWRQAATWYFFQRFKMKLLGQKGLSRDLTLLDQTKKKSMKALDVFSAAIGYFKDHVTQRLLKLVSLVRKNEIRWVLTVPAIWDDGARQFMRESAAKAGIPTEQLVLALEPEAASVYCLRYFQANPSVTMETCVTSQGKRFMTVDCGGGTVDISVFEVGPNGHLKQVHKPEGAGCGGILVDDAFKDFLLDILGFDGVAAIEKKEMLEMNKHFETSKVLFSSEDIFTVRMPVSMTECITCGLRTSKYRDKVNGVRNNLRINKEIVDRFYNESKDGIVGLIKRVMSQLNVAKLDAILLVGGFSESKIIQEAVQKAVPDVRVLVPPSASASVVMGAVMYGHCPSVITCRVAAYTYGTVCGPMFVEGKHDPSKLRMIEGESRCYDVFFVFIHVNDTVVINQTMEEYDFYPTVTGQTETVFDIYRSSARNPMYVTDEGCEKIGKVRVLMPDLTGEKNRKVFVSVTVSGTEMKVRARDENTQKEFVTTCDFLGHSA